MISVSVCIGSSCHLKGSYDIINIFKEIIAENNLESQVELSAAFCLGKCINGVTIKVNNNLVTGVNADNAREIFEKHVLNLSGGIGCE